MSARSRLLLVRHGESEGNFERRFSPNPHIELTERGVEQARAAGRVIRSRCAPVAIVASPTYRREDLLNHAAKLLAPFKRPRLIAELASLCSTPTGKLDRASTKRAAEPHLVPLG